MTIEQRVAVLEEIFAKLQDYYMSDYSGEEIDALLASAGVPIGITKEYDSVSAMNDDFSSTDVTRGQFVLILTTDTSSEDYGKVYLKGSANWVYVFTLTSLTAIKGPQGPAGKTGAKGADGADGKNFMVLGYYETLSALNAAVPSPGTGDTYGVGTEPPYAFYMYDPTISNWRYVGNLQGPAGPTGGEDNFVRYDAAQSLTDEQKAQARANIGADTVQGTVRYDAAQSLTDEQKTQARANIAAAPDGFGLGKRNVTLTASDNLDNVAGNGWYSWGASTPANVPTLINANAAPAYCAMFMIGNSQIVVSFNDRSSMAMRSSNNEGWTPWEYINPHLKPGVEYRTTERYLGKPVYAKTIDCGTVPLNTQKIVSMGVSGRLNKIRCNAWANSDADAFTIPRKLSGTEVTATAASSANNIYISSNTDTLANYTIYATVYYTKATD